MAGGVWVNGDLTITQMTPTVESAGTWRYWKRGAPPLFPRQAPHDGPPSLSAVPQRHFTSLSAKL